MKKNLPDSIVTFGHRDYNLLTALADEITKRAGGANKLANEFSAMLRKCIDDVVMTPKTGRRLYEELEKTEKTYIGTRVEIELRALLNLQKGRLDTLINGHDVDIKNTMGNNWMIPTEAVDHPCILVAADEKHAACYLGLVVARANYLTTGQNKDAKKSISAAGFANILWLLNEQPYPPNFWRMISSEIVTRVFSGKTGNSRVEALFREIQNVPITRDVVEAVAAPQKDFMRRIRADNGKGTRDRLAQEGILLLSGQYDAPLIEELDLPRCTGSEFISFYPKTEDHMEKVVNAGIVLG